MKFLITAGGTREYIDPVRFISNSSSGRMGYALAEAAVRSGHKVTLVSTVRGRQLPAGAKLVEVESAEEMFNAVRKNFANCDCLIMAAAVADYTPIKTSQKKIKKQSKTLVIRLKPTADILKWAGVKKIKKQGSKIIIGFALEDRNLRVNAERKLKEKHLDMVIANSPSVIGSEKTSVDVKMVTGEWEKISNVSKRSLASRIIRKIEKISR